MERFNWLRKKEQPLQEKSGEKQLERLMNEARTLRGRMVSAVGSFDELYSVIGMLGAVRDEDETFDPEGLTDVIGRVRSGELGSEYVPRTHGIRAAVLRLTEFGESAEHSVSLEERLIDGAESFNELYEVIGMIGSMQGSQETFEPEVLTDIIDRVRDGEDVISAITRVHGIRTAVFRLVNREERINNLSEEEKERLVSEAEVFTELFQVIEMIGPVRGSRETFEPGQVIHTINRVREEGFPVEDVTRAYGIRDAVRRIMESGYFVIGSSDRLLDLINRGVAQ